MTEESYEDHCRRVRAQALQAAATVAGSNAVHSDVVNGGPDLDEVTPAFARLVAKFEAFIEDGEDLI